MKKYHDTYEARTGSPTTATTSSKKKETTKSTSNTTTSAASKSPSKVTSKKKDLNKATTSTSDKKEETPVQVQQPNTTPGIVSKENGGLKLNPDRKPLMIKITQLKEAVQAVLDDGRYTPLLLDESERTDTFLQYAGDDPFDCLLLDCKRLVLEQSKLIPKPASDPDSSSSASPELKIHQTFINALKYGKALCFILNNSAYSFKNWSKLFPDSKLVPTDLSLVFQAAGRALLKPEVIEPFTRAMKEDLEPHGIFVADPKFKVIVSSRFSLEDYEEFLGPSLPLEYLYPIYIEPN